MAGQASVRFEDNGEVVVLRIDGPQNFSTLAFDNLNFGADLVSQIASYPRDNGIEFIRTKVCGMSKWLDSQKTLINNKAAEIYDAAKAYRPQE